MHIYEKDVFFLRSVYIFTGFFKNKKQVCKKKNTLYYSIFSKYLLNFFTLPY